MDSKSSLPNGFVPPNSYNPPFAIPTRPSPFTVHSLTNSISQVPLPISPQVNSSVSYYTDSTSPNNSSVQMELEMLRKKISLLEKSVKPEQPNEPPLVWLCPSDDFSFLIGNYPSSPEAETFSFHSRFNPFFTMCTREPRHYGPLSWIALIRIDNAVSSMIDYKRKSNAQKRKWMSIGIKKNDAPSERLFTERARGCFGEEEALKDKSSKRPQALSGANKDSLYERAKAFGLTYYKEKLDPEMPLLDKITRVLQTRKVIWLLIDRFFEEVALIFPFVDEFDFTSTMERILGPRSYVHERIPKLNTESRSDMVQLGILLIVLRFSYLSLFTSSDALNEESLYTSDPSPEAQTKKFLLDNPIDIDYAELAEACLHQFNFLRSCTLPILQLALCVKRYYMFSPENGEVPEDSHSQSFTAMLINMAIGLGLHREPDNMDASVRDERTNNLGRKIWGYLLILDVEGAITNGLPLSVTKSSFDTKPPYHKPGNENLKNLEAEKSVIALYSRLELGYSSLCLLVEMITSLEPVSMSRLTGMLSDLEVDFVKDHASFNSSYEDEINSGNTGVHAIKSKIYFQSQFFIVSVNFHFFNFYESLNNFDLAYFYLKKLVVISIYDMLPFYENFIENSRSQVRGTTDLATTPSLQSLVHKSIIVMLAIMVRARFSILFFEGFPMHANNLQTDPAYKHRYELISQTFNLTNGCLQVLVGALSKLSSRYYYSWRCVKAQSHLQSVFNGTDYYQNWCKGNECYMKLTNEMLEDFNGILEKTLQRAKTASGNPVTHEQNSASSDICSANTTVGNRTPMVIPEATPGNNYAYNSLEIDNLWFQMMSGKPKRGQEAFYTRTPPMTDNQVGTFEEIFGNAFDDGIGFPNNYDGMSLFETAPLDDLTSQGFQ